MTNFEIEFEFQDINETINSLKNFKKQDDLVAQSYGYLIVKINNKVIDNPWCKHNTPDCGKHTDTTWLIKIYYDLMEFLENGVNEEYSKISFLDNPLYFVFRRKENKIETLLTYNIDKGITEKSIIASTYISERELSHMIINSAEKLYLFFIKSNPKLIKDLKFFKEKLKNCKIKYNIT